MIATQLVVLAENGGGGGASTLPTTLIFFGLMFAVIYFLILRPQKKKEQRRRTMLESTRRGDRVVTIGGIHGEVKSIKENEIVLLVDRDNGMTLKFNRSAIHRIVGPGSEEEDEQR